MLFKVEASRLDCFHVSEVERASFGPVITLSKFESTIAQMPPSRRIGDGNRRARGCMSNRNCPSTPSSWSHWAEGGPEPELLSCGAPRDRPVVGKESESGAYAPARGRILYLKWGYLGATCESGPHGGSPRTRGELKARPLTRGAYRVPTSVDRWDWRGSLSA